MFLGDGVDDGQANSESIIDVLDVVPNWSFEIAKGKCCRFNVAVGSSFGSLVQMSRMESENEVMWIDLDLSWVLHFEADLEVGVTADFDLDGVTLGATAGATLSADLGLGLDLVAIADGFGVTLGATAGVTVATLEVLDLFFLVPIREFNENEIGGNIDLLELIDSLNDDTVHCFLGRDAATAA